MQLKFKGNGEQKGGLPIFEVNEATLSNCACVSICYSKMLAGSCVTLTSQKLSLGFLSAKETVELSKGGAFMISVEENNFKNIRKEENPQV